MLVKICGSISRVNSINFEWCISQFVSQDNGIHIKVKRHVLASRNSGLFESELLYRKATVENLTILVTVFNCQKVITTGRSAVDRHDRD
jgi:deoxycytidylate deaminase